MSKIQLPAVLDGFAKTALSLPSKIDRILATIRNANDAVDVIDQVEVREHFARRIKADTPILNALVCSRLKSIAAWAALSPRERGGRGKTSAGGTRVFSGHTIATYRKVGNHADKVDDYWRDATAAGTEMSPKQFLDYVGSGGVIATKHGNDVIEWYTPKEYIEACRQAMGSIDTDPASNKAAQKTVKADTFHTAQDSGLDYPWHGNVFLNPPFKMPLVAQFVAQLIDELAQANASQAILLTNNNTDTNWWQSAAQEASSICFTNGRVSFYNDAGEWSSPTNGQTFMYFGRRIKTFVKLFSDFGICMP